jgi:hypothetical protein
MVNWRPWSDEEYGGCLEGDTHPKHNFNKWFEVVKSTSTLARRHRRHTSEIGNDVTLDPDTRQLMEESVRKNIPAYKEMWKFRLQPLSSQS